MIIERLLSGLASYFCRIFLRQQRQLGSEKTMRLRHGCLGTVDDVVYQLLSVRQINIVALDILGFLMIDQKKMIYAIPSRNINVFTDFHVSFHAENG